MSLISVENNLIILIIWINIQPRSTNRCTKTILKSNYIFERNQTVLQFLMYKLQCFVYFKLHIFTHYLNFNTEIQSLRLGSSILVDNNRGNLVRIFVTIDMRIKIITYFYVFEKKKEKYKYEYTIISTCIK